jgi:hypothetical protein
VLAGGGTHARLRLGRGLCLRDVVARGQLEVLQWMREHQGVWDERICQYAAEFDVPEVLKWRRITTARVRKTTEEREGCFSATSLTSRNAPGTVNFKR